MKTRAYSNATLCQNFKAIGEELSEIQEPVQTNIYIFIYIDYYYYVNSAYVVFVKGKF
jgi:hypothetical protein